MENYRQWNMEDQLRQQEVEMERLQQQQHQQKLELERQNQELEWQQRQWSGRSGKRPLIAISVGRSSAAILTKHARH